MKTSMKGLTVFACLGAFTSANAATVLKDFTNNGDATGVYGSFTKTPGITGIAFTAINGDGGAFISQSNVALQNTEQLQITLKLGPTNTDNQFQILLLDADGPANGEAYRYMIQTSNFNASTFTTFTFGPLTGWTGFNPDTFGRGAGDTIQNFGSAADTGLYEFQIQGDFEGGGQVLDIVVQNVSVVPEPTSFTLGGLGALGLLVRRRRR
jgi:MYXO-CTERM domain-containing protein